MKRTLVTWSLILVALGCMAWFLAAATRPLEAPARYADSGSTFTLTAPKLRELDAGGVRLIASAAEARYVDNRVVADDLSAEVTRDGKITRIKAAEGIYSLQSTTATLKGGVTVAGDDGLTFTTASAVYRHDARRVSAAGAFKAEGRGITLRGYGLHYDITADSFTVDKNVGASIQRFTF